MIRHVPWRYPPSFPHSRPGFRIETDRSIFCIFFRRGAASSAQKPRKSAIFAPALARKKYTLCIISQNAFIGRPCGRGGAAAAPERRLPACVRKCHGPSCFSVSGRIPAPQGQAAPVGFLCKKGTNRIPLPLGEGLGEGAPAAALTSDPGGCSSRRIPLPLTPSPKGRGTRTGSLRGMCGDVMKCHDSSFGHGRQGRGTGSPPAK